MHQKKQQQKQGHMSKDELKENKLLDIAIQARHYIVEHKHQIIRVSLILVVLLIAFVFYLIDQASREDAARLKLGKAYSLLANEDGKGIKEADSKLSEIVNEYPGTFAARKAHFHLGNIKFQLAQFDQALKHFRNVTEDSGDTYLYPAALISCGDCHVQMQIKNKNRNEDQDSLRKALEYYDRVLTDAGGQGFDGTALVKKFHVQLALNDIDNAQKTIDELSKSSSRWQDRAQELATYLKMLARRSTLSGDQQKAVQNLDTMELQPGQDTLVP